MRNKLERLMPEATRLNDVIEVAESLSLEEQEMLLEVLHNRYIQHRRDELAKDLDEANKEFADGKCKVSTPSDLMGEILS